MWQRKWHGPMMVGAAVGALAVTPSAFAVDYLTIEQAKKVIFSEATFFQEQTILLVSADTCPNFKLEDLVGEK
jgi:hypothetical protein